LYYEKLNTIAADNSIIHSSLETNY